jgi:hypothetical protein
MRFLTENRETPRIQGEEKRRHPRIPVECVTVEVYSKLDEPCLPEICSIINLSVKGMLFETSNKFFVGQVLRLTFMLPNSIVIIRTNALVIHAYHNNQTDYAGVHFLKLGVSERTCLKNFVQKKLSAPTP